MDRREFLRFRTRGRQRVAEVSCERLYVRSVDARLRTDAEDGEFDPVSGAEPPTAIHPLSRARLLESLERSLREADVVQVRGREWLASLDEDWRAGVDAILAGVRARGGRVELVGEAATTEAV